jgi:hypothetical protein
MLLYSDGSNRLITYSLSIQNVGFIAKKLSINLLWFPAL